MLLRIHGALRQTLIGVALWGILIAPSLAPAEPQTEERDPLSTALNVLSHIPSGQQILRQAQSFWNLPIRNVLRWGKASKTDAVLTRHFDTKTGQETREREVVVYLRKDQRLENLILDLVHELVHATSRPSWDPYDPRLTPGKYIWAAIEGEGGEVDAVAFECRVGFELLDRFGVESGARERCEGYLAKKGPHARIDRNLIRRDFYRIGKWGHDLAQQLGTERRLFPLLTSEVPRLFSSTGNAPYPVALLREFEELSQIACNNSRKRFMSERERSPASSNLGAQADVQAFLAGRCSAE